MREPITYPVEGSTKVRLWPGGPRWDEAVILDTQSADGFDFHIWRCTTTDFEGNPVVYVVVVVWPHVWSKATPPLCSGYPWTADKPVSPRDALILTMADLADLKSSGVIRADILIDAREPAPGRDN